MQRAIDSYKSASTQLWLSGTQSRWQWQLSPLYFPTGTTESGLTTSSSLTITGKKRKKRLCLSAFIKNFMRNFELPCDNHR